MMANLQDAIEQAARLLRASKHVVAFTGAGISTPSGIPDFRSQRTGMWERYNPMEVASLAGFQMHPERFYDWLRPLLQVSWSAAPNPAHLALAQLESAGYLKALITQNIDNLHFRAGSRNIYEVHGSLRTMTCTQCRETFPSENFLQILEAAEDGMARCPNCRRVVKPDITLFGEMLPAETWQEAEQHCRQADLMLVAGSSLEVWPAAALPEIAVENGADLIIANLTPTPLDRSASVRLAGDLAAILPLLATRVLA